MNDIKRSEAITKIWDLIRDTKIAMLTTYSSHGLHSRPMAVQESEFDGDLWFLARQQSGKVDEIEHGSSVNLTFANSAAQTYVSLTGQAELTQDRAKIHELWKPMHAAWFPQGKDDPEIMAIQVKVDEAEYWDVPANALVRTFQLMKAVVTNGESKVGEHDKLLLA